MDMNEKTEVKGTQQRAESLHTAETPGCDSDSSRDAGAYTDYGHTIQINTGSANPFRLLGNLIREIYAK